MCDFKEEAIKLMGRFRSWGYPDRLLQKAFNEASNTGRESLLELQGAEMNASVAQMILAS